MLRWAFPISLVSLAAFALLVTSTPLPPPLQPIHFSHKVHLDYFRDRGENGHRQSMVSMHEGTLEEYKDGRHRQAMVSRHKEILLKELEDEEIVAQIIKEQIEPGYCNQCHRDYDENADLAKLSACAECHRRKDQDVEGFGAGMIVDVENGRCTACHGDFGRNAGENLSRLGHCAECHRASHDRDWEGREDERPCMGCHNGVFQSPLASIPNTNTCAACHQPHQPRLGDDPEEIKLVEEFIEQEREIPWARVYDYLPGEIVFSHERHVEMGRVKCQECHPLVEQAEGPLSLEMELSMEACMSCHDEPATDEEAGTDNVRNKADNDCLACHR